MARAVADCGGLLTVSSNAGTRFEAIGEAGVAWWVQAYLPVGREAARPMRACAVTAGARAVVLTAESPVMVA